MSCGTRTLKADRIKADSSFQPGYVPVVTGSADASWIAWGSMTGTIETEKVGNNSLMLVLIFEDEDNAKPFCARG